MRVIAVQDQGVDAFPCGPEVLACGPKQDRNARRCLTKLIGRVEHAVHESPMPSSNIIEPWQLLLANGDQPEPLPTLGTEDHVEPADVQQSPRFVPFPVGAIEEEEIAPLHDVDARPALGSHETPPLVAGSSMSPLLNYCITTKEMLREGGRGLGGFGSNLGFVSRPPHLTASQGRGVSA